MQAASDAPVLLFDELPGGIRRLTLNRPQSLNALTLELVTQLADAIEASEQESSALLLQGAGRAFCSGADLSWLKHPEPGAFDATISEFHRLILAIVKAPIPVVAHVNGPAAGFGCDLALACDLRWAQEGAFLQESFSEIGLMPDGGGSYFLHHFLGPRAFSSIAFAERMDTEFCSRWGLFDRVFQGGEQPGQQPGEQELNDALFALSQRSQPALREIKAALRLQRLPGLELALAREAEGQKRLLQGADFREGLQAFLEKRPPNYQAR